MGQFQEADPESCRDVFCHGITRVFQIPQQTTYKDMSCFSTMPKNTSNSQLDIVCFFGFWRQTIHLFEYVFFIIYIYICIYVTKTREDNHPSQGIPMTYFTAVAGQHQAVALVDEAFGLQKGHRWHRSVIFWG